MRVATLGAVAAFVVACSSEDASVARLPCVPEEAPNDTVLTKTFLGSLKDDDLIGDPKPDTRPGEVDAYFSTHTTTDIDWYEVSVSDTGINGNPQIRVSVTQGFEAAAFWSCTGTPAEYPVACQLGTRISDDPDIGNAEGCTTIVPAGGVVGQVTMSVECDGSDDSGRLLLRVKNLAPSDQCVIYRLQVTVE